MRFTIHTDAGELTLTDEQQGPTKGVVLLGPTGELLNTESLVAAPDGLIAQEAGTLVLWWAISEGRTPEEGAAAHEYLDSQERSLPERVTQPERLTAGLDRFNLARKLSDLDGQQTAECEILEIADTMTRELVADWSEAESNGDDLNGRRQATTLRNLARRLAKADQWEAVDAIVQRLGPERTERLGLTR